jgi:phosphatidylserine/phosphatidylglycerophosphate/cardiolipin synthase-like enzyme
VIVACRIPSKEVGKIIGKGGETIKSLQAEFGVHINVPKGQEPSTEVIVGGPAKQNVDAALAKISNILGHSVGQAASGAVAQVAQKFDLSTSQPIREALFFPDASNVAYEKFYNYLRSATKSIDIAVYTLSDNRIEELLLLAHKAGVKIRIVSGKFTVDLVFLI